MRDPIEESAEGRPPLPSQTLQYENVDEPLSTSLAATEEVRETDQTRIASPFRDAVRRFSRNWAAVLSVVVVILLVLAAIFAPFLHSQNPTAIDPTNLLAGPSAHHWFGTDAEGRDEYSRILYGLRVPFIVSLVGTVLTVIVALALGLAAGYYGGFVDSIVSRFTDLMFAFPAILLILIIVSLWGTALNNTLPNGVGQTIVLTGVFALVSWPPLMRFIRSLALGMKEQQFIEAARTVGTTNARIITRHLVPNVWGLVLVQAALTVAYILGAEAVLSILGMGVQQPTPDLGYMLYDGAQYMDASAWGAFFPSLFLTILILAFTFIGDGVRDAVDPRSSD